MVVVLARQDAGPRKGKAALRAGMLALDEFTNPAVEHVVEMEHQLDVIKEEDESGEGKAGGRRPEGAERGSEQMGRRSDDA